MTNAQAGTAVPPYTLVILRHAKAARPDGMPDPDRPLTSRGHRDAGAAGEWLIRTGRQPELVLCSPARRTRETWDAAAAVLSSHAEVSYPSELYTAGVASLLAKVAHMDPQVHTVLLIGHNPSVSLLSAMLAAGTGGDDEFDGLATAGLAVHQRDAAWPEWRDSGAALVETYTARG